MVNINKAETGNIILQDVSRFYGEVLGVNRVNLEIPPGITSLVGPNGSGKTTLLNLITGLIRPSKGTIRVLNIPYNQPEKLFPHIGYCTQYDIGYEWLTGFEFLYSMLLIHGYPKKNAANLSVQALKTVNMTMAKDKKLGAYSKGMKQRMKIAIAIAHDPLVLIFDEPLQGLDPMARIEMIDLFHRFVEEKKLLIISSHILPEVETLADNVVLLNHGYVVAEGNIQQVRSEMKHQHPLQIFVQCDKPAVLCSNLFELDGIVSVNILEDNRGVLVCTRDSENFYVLINQLVTENVIDVQTITPADDNVQAVYDYLIGALKED